MVDWKDQGKGSFQGLSTGLLGNAEKSGLVSPNHRTEYWLGIRSMNIIPQDSGPLCITDQK
jgi:hypothetical protein